LFDAFSSREPVPTSLENAIKHFRGRPVDATASRSSRFDGSDSLGDPAESAAALCLSDNRAHREYRRRRHGRMGWAVDRRRTPKDNTGPIGIAAAPSRSGSICRPGYRHVAVAARRRAAVAMVLDFLDWGIAFVQRVSRSSQLERESHAGNACEHFEVPPGELLYPSPSLLQHCMSSTATRAEWNIQIAFTPGLTRN